jgi:hypothetical protein
VPDYVNPWTAPESPMGNAVAGEPPFRVRTVVLTLVGAASIMALIGGVLGMMAGVLALKIVIGLYALDGPEPPLSFSPVAWGIQKGIVFGLMIGTGSGSLASFAYAVGFWRRFRFLYA